MYLLLISHAKQKVAPMLATCVCLDGSLLDLYVCDLFKLLQRVQMAKKCMSVTFSSAKPTKNNIYSWFIIYYK